MPTNPGLDGFRRVIKTAEYRNRQRDRQLPEYRPVERMGLIIGVKYRRMQLDCRADFDDRALRVELMRDIRQYFTGVVGTPLLEFMQMPATDTGFIADMRVHQRGYQLQQHQKHYEKPTQACNHFDVQYSVGWRIRVSSGCCRMHEPVFYLKKTILPRLSVSTSTHIRQSTL